MTAEEYEQAFFGEALAPVEEPDDLVYAEAVVLSVEKDHVVVRIPRVEALDDEVDLDEEGESCEGFGEFTTCKPLPPPLPPLKPVLPREAALLTQTLRNLLPELQSLVGKIDDSFDPPGGT